jgi:chitinase
MADLRAGLTALGSETGRRYLLTTAINPSKQQMARIPMARAARSLDLVFLMTYDFYGNWSTRAGHHTALRGPVSGDDSVEASVANLRRAGVPARQLVAGVAMYGRGFEGVQADGSFKAPWPAPDGAVAYRDLAALPGVKPRFDTRTQSWALVGEGGRFVGYDDPRTVRAKAAFVRQRGLAGLFAWELGQDNGEILNAMQP